MKTIHDRLEYNFLLNYLHQVHFHYMWVRWIIKYFSIQLLLTMNRVAFSSHLEGYEKGMVYLHNCLSNV